MSRDLRLLVCGSRGCADEVAVRDYLDGVDPEVLLAVIVGDCRGPDTYAANWAIERRAAGVELWQYPADWHGEGRAAGPKRNERMIRLGKPTAFVAFWDGKSRGTLDAMSRCVGLGISGHIMAAEAKP